MKIHWIFIALTLIFTIGLLTGYFIKPGITGYASVSGGQTTALGEQQKNHPNLGAAKGYMVFTVQDPSGGIVSKVTAANISVYLVKNGVNVGSWSRVKDSGIDLGVLSNIDADDSGARCSSTSFISDSFYEDENDNGVNEPNEKEIYHVKTDSNGCFAILAKPGNWDIYT